jgi:hypothetical protein
MLETTLLSSHPESLLTPHPLWKRSGRIKRRFREIEQETSLLLDWRPKELVGSGTRFSRREVVKEVSLVRFMSL